MVDATQNVVVVGASRGLGRGIARQFARQGSHVIAIARESIELQDLARGSEIEVEAGDATDADFVSGIMRRHRPATIVIAAGAVPALGALHEHTWESFSVNWHADVKIAFTWLRASLLMPLAGRHVVVVSSGAALNGSPASGGYAGSKATQRFTAQYAQEESDRAHLGLTVTTVLPRITPHGQVGRAGISVYSARANQTEQEYVAGLGDPLTPEGAGTAIARLVGLPVPERRPAYMLTADGLMPI